MKPTRESNLRRVVRWNARALAEASVQHTSFGSSVSVQKQDNEVKTKLTTRLGHRHETHRSHLLFHFLVLVLAVVPTAVSGRLVGRVAFQRIPANAPNIAPGYLSTGGTDVRREAPCRFA